MTPEQLETRWVTAQGRSILQRVLGDLHDEGGLNLPAILGELEGTNEVQDGLDLRYAPLEGEHLEEVNLYAVNLSGAFLAGARLQKADIRDARLEGAILDGCDLRGAYLSNTVLAGAMMKNVNLDGAMLDGSDLSGAILAGASCKDTYFSNAVLQNADLRQSDLSQADFSNATCRGASVSAGAMERVAVMPTDREAMVIEQPAPRPRPTMRRRPSGGPSGAMRRPAPGRGRASTMAMRPPAGRPPLSGAMRRPPPPRGGNGEPPLRDWDQAIARLVPLRKNCSRIIIVIDGREEILFEA